MTPTNLARKATCGSTALLALALAAGAAPAQSPESAPRWEAWIGCWEPTGISPAAAGDTTATPVTCVIPTGDAAVEVVTVLDGEVVHRESVQANERRRVEREGCNGWERVAATARGRHLYRQSEYSCEGDLQRRSTGLMTMAQGKWLDITGVSAGGYTDVQVVRYRPADAPDALDPGAREALRGRNLAVEAARLAAAAPVSTQDVVEASRQLDAEVIEAWLVEREQSFAIDARELVRLADAGVPERIIDLMVALSYPEVFVIDRDSRAGELRPEPDVGRSTRPRPGYGWGYPGYGYYPRYGYGGYRGYPIVIVERDTRDDDSRARAVKGRGYTRGGSGASGRATTSTRPSDSQSGTASDSRDSGSSGTRRTAKPRPGGG